jgi:hypothetical protein
MTPEGLAVIQNDWLSALRERGFQRAGRRWLHESSARTFVIQVASKAFRGDAVPYSVVRMDWGIFTEEFARIGWPFVEAPEPEVPLSIARGPVVDYNGFEVTWELWPTEIRRDAWPGAPSVQPDMLAQEVHQHLDALLDRYIPGPTETRELYESLIDAAGTGKVTLNPTFNGDPLVILRRLVGGNNRLS